MTHNIFNRAQLSLAGAAVVALFGGLLSLGTAAIDSGPAAATPTGSAYFPLLSPVRIADTRADSNLPNQGQTLGPAGIDVIAIPTADVPLAAHATAVVLNVTAVNATAQSYFTVYPTGDTHALQAGGTNANFSDLNFYPGASQPNLVTTPIGTSNSVSVFNDAGSADVVVDLEGYYGTQPSNPAGQFYPVEPTRIVDTRPGSTFTSAGQTIQANSTLNVQVSGEAGLPAASAISAVVLNVTATNTTEPSYFTVFPAGTAQPNASNLNWNTGVTIPNRVIVPLNSAGQVSIYNYLGTADAVVDVDGYFSSASGAGSGGSLFNPLTPARISDTRESSGYLNQGSTLVGNDTAPVQVSGQGDVPEGITGAVLNVTEATSTLGGYLTVYPATTGRPSSSDLNFTPNLVIANADMVGVDVAGVIDIYNYTGSTNVAVDVFGYYVPAVAAT
jgi:hypothetical protein